MTSTALSELPIFKSEAGSQLFADCYEKLMTYWPGPYETMEIKTEFGLCHVIACGPEEGKPVLMFHGMTSNSALWYPTIEALTDCRVYCIDTPGDFGKSKVIKQIRTPEDAVLWMDQLLDGLKLEKPAFIGHSMGGWLCSNYATARPERIERLVLLAPVATFLPIPFLRLLRKVYPAMLWPKPDRIRRAWDWFCTKGFSLPPHVMNLVIAAYTHGRSQLPVVPRVISKEAWSKLSAPVLFLVGDEEKIYKANKVMERVKKTLQDSEVILINGAGHCLIIEQQSAVNEAIRRFITVMDDRTA